MTYPSFSAGQVLTAADMNAVGLWLVKSQTVGTGVTSVTVTGAFSATYDNYLITFAGGTMSADTALTMQLGSTVTGYNGVFIYGTTAGALAVAPDSNNSRITYVGGGSNNASAFFSVISPNLAKHTKVGVTAVGYSTTYGSYSGAENSNTQHTAFTLTPFTGTMTGGTIRVYGYKN